MLPRTSQTPTKFPVNALMFPVSNAWFSVRFDIVYTFLSSQGVHYIKEGL